MTNGMPVNSLPVRFSSASASRRYSPKPVPIGTRYCVGHAVPTPARFLSSLPAGRSAAAVVTRPCDLRRSSCRDLHRSPPSPAARRPDGATLTDGETAARDRDPAQRVTEAGHAAALIQRAVSSRGGRSSAECGARVRRSSSAHGLAWSSARRADDRTARRQRGAGCHRACVRHEPARDRAHATGVAAACSGVSRTRRGSSARRYRSGHGSGMHRHEMARPCCGRAESDAPGKRTAEHRVSWMCAH